MKQYQLSDLRPYQHQIKDFIKGRDFSAAWVEMGLGKTVSTLTAFADMAHRFDAAHLLVVAPLRVARKVWSDEVKTWSHLDGLKVQPIIGSANERFKQMRTWADVHTINVENLPWLMAQFIENKKQIRRWPWDMVVLDEAQRFKNPEGVWQKAARKVRRLTPTVTELTGSPMPNGYMDLWGQIRLLDQGARLGHTITSYRDRWFDAHVNEQSYTQWTLKDGAAEAIQARIADLVLVMKTEDHIKDLPGVLYNPVRVVLPGAALAKCKKLLKENIAEFSDYKVNAINRAALIGKLLQIANGAVYYDKKNWVHVHDEKIDALLELVDGASGPVMICFGFKHDVARIEAALAKAYGTTKRVARLESEATEDAWNAGKIDCLLLHPASAGHGLNLQHAGSTTIVWFGLTNNLEWFEQANARLIGGHRRRAGIVIHQIVADHAELFDWDMLELLERKDTNQVTLMRAVQRLAAAR